MLEAEEVEDDFFTPVAGTSLANIFGNVSQNKESSQKDSLKYVPPKPHNIVPNKKEPVKATERECIFACAINAHEWTNNVYTSKGKLGFAIFKIQKTGDHNIVLYDYNKSTLSNATITTSLDVTIRNNTYISYFDSIQKYWSLSGTEDDTKKIAEVLKNCGANVIHSADSGLGSKPKSETETNLPLEQNEQQNQESDTDSSNRKTRASILNRISNMGHSVLPTRALPSQKSSDSSDTNETETQPKVVRHKPIKTSLKKNSVDNIVSEDQNSVGTHQNVLATRTEPQRNINLYDGQLLPMTSSSVFANTSNELGMFISEQRISNSELRINLNRITDKVDSVLDKMNKIEPKDKGKNLSTDILLKLLTEYENKIAIYEDLLKSRGMDNRKIMEDRLTTANKDSEVESFKQKISEIEKENEQMSFEISYLQSEMKLLKDKYTQENKNQISKESELITKMNRLEEDLEIKRKELIELTNSSATNAQVSNDNIGEKVKNIMNNTFQTISVNFDNNEDYSGETVKRIIGTVIKKITIETLKEL